MKKHCAPGASSSVKVCRAPVAFSWYLTSLTGKEMGKKPIGFQTRLRQLHQGGAYLQVAPAREGPELQALHALQNEVHSQRSSTECEEGAGGDGRGCGSIAARGG